MHVNRRSPYLESFAIHKAEDIHAGSRGPRARLRRPLSRQQQRQQRQPHGRPGPQRAPGLEGGGDGWRRRPGRARTGKRRASTSPPQAACASPGRTIDGRRCRENSMERGPGRASRAGWNAAREPPGAPGEGVALAPRPAGPGSPACRGAQTEREAAGEPGTRARTLPALQLPACLLPRAQSLFSPHPQPAGGGGGLSVTAASASGSERSDLTVSDGHRGP